MKRLLLTGASGFLGSTIARAFSNRGWEVYGIDRTPAEKLLPDLKEYVALSLPSIRLSELLRIWKPEACVHAAGPASVGLSMIDPWFDFQNSVPIWANLLEQMRLNLPDCKMIFLSSAAVYGEPQTLPMSEAHPVLPISPYGYHKQMCEQLSEYYGCEYGLRVCNLRIFSAYGPRLRRQVLWDICRKAIYQDVVELMGTGLEQRDFIEAFDIARAIEIVLEHGKFDGRPYNVASGQATTIASLVSHILDAMHVTKPVVFNQQHRAGDPQKWLADISSIKSLGFEPEISLVHGIQTYISWFFENQELCIPLKLAS